MHYIIVIHDLEDLCIYLAWVFIHSIELIIVSYHLLAKLNIIHHITAEATVAYLGFHSGGGTFRWPGAYK